MKTLATALITLIATQTFAESNCGDAVDKYFTEKHFQVRQIQHQSDLPEGQKAYYARTNYWGGDAAWEVVVNSRCEILKVTELWSE